MCQQHKNWGVIFKVEGKVKGRVNCEWKDSEVKILEIGIENVKKSFRGIKIV